MNKRIIPAVLAAAAVSLAACSGQEVPTRGGGDNADGAASADAIRVTGSATVEPITAAIAQRGNYELDISSDGTTDGFEEFCNGDSDINDASVAIPGDDAPVDYEKMCADNGVDYVELPIALDAVTIVKNDENSWAEDLTLDQLEEIWSKDSAVRTWADVNPEWPDEQINLYGRPDGSGTLGYFASTVLDGNEIRGDYQTTDDIDELSGWIADDVNGIGFMGIGNYLSTTGEIRDRIDNVTVDGIAPNREETQTGNYPMSRTLYIYVNKESLDKDHVHDFAAYYLEHVKDVLPRVYFYALPEADYEKAQDELK